MRPGTRAIRSAFTPSAAASESRPVRVGIVAHRGRVGRRNAGAREIDRGVERVAAEREAVAVVGAARQLDHHFADADDAGFLSHGSPDLRGANEARGGWGCHGRAGARRSVRSLPLEGEGRGRRAGRGGCALSWRSTSQPTPTPLNPSPQGGGEQSEFAARASPRIISLILHSQRSAARLRRARVPLRPFPLPEKNEGSRAPTGAGAERRTRWSVSRADRSPDRRRSPAQ